MTIDTQNHLEAWEKYYKELSDAYLFPNEYVVRAFLGNYPNLQMPKEYLGKTICDVGCGDGRNIMALNKFGFKVTGTEISSEICNLTKSKLFNHPDRINVDIHPGLNDQLPFFNSEFDFILSWNACYYLKDESANISSHIREHARILKSNGYFIVSVPGPQCFTLHGAEKLQGGRIRIRNQKKWKVLEGQIFHSFNNFDEIEKEFGSHFYNFQKATIDDDCFGLRLQYFIFVCQKKPFDILHTPPVFSAESSSQP